MNAKKKNKKANKPPNPNPPQSVENVPKYTENVEEIQTKCEVKEVQSITPEICSEVVATPVSDVKVIESETPKKPKRNKGKKKKQDQDEDLDENIQEEQSIQSESKAEVQKSVQKIESKETEEKIDPLEEANVVPSARKKKNKKKSQEKPTEESKILDEVSVPVLKKDTKEEIAKMDPNIQELLSATPETPKQDAKKKKNKKKNRTDSERSDKSENILSCTSAFQNLLVEDEIAKEDKPEGNQKSLKNIPLQSNCENTEQIAENVIETKPVEEIKEPTKAEPLDIKELPKDENKNKKKNKKDKKQTHKDIVESPKFDVPQEISCTVDDILTQKVTSDESNQNVKKCIEIPTDLTKEREPSPKPKAKIAKPVGKNRKDKQDGQSLENVSNIESSKDVKELSKEHELKLDEISAVDFTESQISDQATSTSGIPKLTENINVPIDSTMGKKRKKSPKPPINKETHTVKVDVVEMPENTRPKETETKESTITAVSDLIQPETVIVSNKPEEITPKVAEVSSEGKSKPQGHHKVDLIESKLFERSITPEMKVDDEGFETKTSKKKKKTPKIPQAATPSEAKKPVASFVIKKNEDDQEKSKQVTEEKMDFPLDLPADLEIRSVRTESEASSCDAIPDVFFVRSSSQHLLDSNNNTVIQELIYVDEIKLSDPLQIPLIEGSGETPICTPEPVTSGIRMSEIEAKTSTEEKTDIKSKMMEVNQDMEELKISIERSLAEFTALEQSEQESEKKSESETVIKKRKLPQVEKKLESKTLMEKEKSPQIEKKLESKTLMEKEKSPQIENKSGSKTLLEKEKSPHIEKKLESKTLMEKQKSPQVEKKSEIKTLLEKEKTPLMEKKLESTSLLETEKLSPKDSKTKKVEETLLTKELKGNVPTKVDTKEPENLSQNPAVEFLEPIVTPPVCPTRKDNKGKSKSKKKGKQETTSATTSAIPTESSTTKSQSKDNAKDEKQEKSEKSEQKTEPTQEKGKQQSTAANDSNDTDIAKDIDNEKQPIDTELIPEQTEFEPIENFEDALTSSIDDGNITFEMIAKDVDDDNIEFQKKLAANKPEINITEATDDTDTKRNEKVNPVSQPKNLLGQIDFPVQSNKTDYKKEKNKTPNARQARVKIKDSMDVEGKKKSKESQTDNKRARKNSDKSVKESFSRVKNDEDEYVYKYSFRKVFLQSACHVCNKDLRQVRVPCGYCNLVFYCGAKHKDEDWPQHQALCFAVSTLAHMKDQKHIYADAQNATGQDYRLLRMQMIVSCEKVLKRRLVPWEQEAMLYPRLCADAACREWRQEKLKDCDGCGQLSYCAAHPDHFPKSHTRWCKSYSLYQKLVSYQQTKGRLEPRLPTKVMTENMPGKMNEVLAAMYEEKIDMNDIQYASLTQLATAPLTTAYCLQLCRTGTGITNGVHKKQPFTIHVVGAELQFEADALNKWETFFLHLKPDVEELRVVLVSPMLNPGNLPLDLLGRIKLCDNCRQNKRRVVFKFEDNKNYFEYRSSEEFINPDIICAFNPSIQRSSIYNGKDPWPAAINSILKLKRPFVITSYTLNELRKDIARVKQVAEMDFKLILEPGFNSFASVRPDRNFISDNEMPLLFKNYCVAVLLGY